MTAASATAILDRLLHHCEVRRRPRGRTPRRARRERGTDGTRREGRLRAGDGMDCTADVLAETATRLARHEAPAGAYTPATAFGPDLATAAGGTFILDQ
ncbi:hypothetical protein ACIBU0_35355 [Streptomyces sp. NPDC049627]|uniref:hypothetical protein n=1 Tax=Streptomyces sp. NPDC049627 TaxID=3365595 RepID=UPI003792722C